MGMKVMGKMCFCSLKSKSFSFSRIKKKSIWGEIKGDQQIYNSYYELKGREYLGWIDRSKHLLMATDIKQEN